MAALIFLGALAMPASAASDAETAAAEVLSDKAFQRDFPGTASSPDFSMPGGNGAGSQGSDSPDASSSPVEPATPPNSSPAKPAPPPEPSSPTAPLDLSAVFIALGIGVVVLLGLYFWSRRGMSPAATTPGNQPKAAEETRSGTEASMVPAVGQTPQSVLHEAEQLAAAGRYGEAIHLILLRALAELKYTTDISIATSATSREVLRHKSLPQSMKEGLSILVGAVELCHFGGRDADQRLFQHCVDAFHRHVLRVPAASGVAP